MRSAALRREGRSSGSANHLLLGRRHGRQVAASGIPSVGVEFASDPPGSVGSLELSQVGGNVGPGLPGRDDVGPEPDQDAFAPDFVGWDPFGGVAGSPSAPRRTTNPARSLTDPGSATRAASARPGSRSGRQVARLELEIGSQPPRSGAVGWAPSRTSDPREVFGAVAFWASGTRLGLAAAGPVFRPLVRVRRMPPRPEARGVRRRRVRSARVAGSA